ncbi:alpha/beta hydrolase fold domain-containing protein [Candidatus Acetothermia bacterium]|nr:alpha/beta hydrolase fold domain-containing protein [Candidatus Acetothermia bacterium]
MKKRTSKLLSLMMIGFVILAGSASARMDSADALFGVSTHIESSDAQTDHADIPTANFTLGPDLPNPIRPLLGVNDGPAPTGDARNPDLTQQYQQAGVTLVRTHDFYGPMDMSQIFPNQDADPSNPASYNFTASDSIFSAIVKGGFEPYLRLGDSWNNVRRITNRANWVKAAVEVVRHFNDSARWGKSPLHYIEVWNEPDGHFWVGPREEFFALFADAAKTLKATFPNLKIGGPGFTPAGFLAPQGQAYAKAFISYMKTNNVPLDFFSWHVYSNDPNDFPNAAKFYRGLLDANGYTTTESHISEWNTEYNPERNMTDPTVRTSARASVLMTAAWIGLQEQNVTVSAVYRGNDPSLNAPTWYGIFYADSRPKPVGLAFQLWSQMATHSSHQQITVSSATELHALAGHSSLGEITILIANPTEKSSSWQLALPPSTSTNYSITLQQITGAGTEIQTSTLSGLSSEIAAYTTQLVTLKPASTLSLNQAQSGLIDRDVTYCTADNVALKMDIYHPTPTSNAPVAMYVHGGGWTSGDKRGGAGAIDIPELVARGYLVVSVNYRLAPQYKFPAMIEDVKCAIRFLRANAAKYNLNPNKMGAWGGSAGGHLVSLLGTTDASAGFEGNGGYADQSSRVQAVVDMFGPTDLPALFKNPASAQQVFRTSDKNSEILQRASPVNWVSKDDPPFLILQGEKDDVVPPSQSQGFYDKLIATGVPATLVMVKNAGHGFAPVGGSISPTRQELTKMIGDFFDKYLK